jgi:glycerol-3-phosphate dehydrogenase (NAD(P)+)
MKIAVLGAGGWGTTLAILLHTNKHQVTLWEYDKLYAESLKKSYLNTLYLPGIKIPDKIFITHDLKEASYKKDFLILAVPSQYLRSIMEKMRPGYIKDTILVSVAKGIENDSLLTMSQMLKGVLPFIDESQIGVLSGPSHAEEVSRKIPTAVVAASKDVHTSRKIQSAFMTSYFRVYSSTDILGVELGGSLKNVIAIGAGIIDGANLGDNTKAAIMTRGIAEMSRLGVAIGAKPETFAGLSGMGDLIVTCMSKHSRNRHVGEQIGSGLKLKNILETMQMVAEGVQTTKSALALGEKNKVETPIIKEVYNILFKDKDPVKATYDLMTRDMKMELFSR